MSFIVSTVNKLTSFLPTPVVETIAPALSFSVMKSLSGVWSSPNILREVSSVNLLKSVCSSSLDNLMGKSSIQLAAWGFTAYTLDKFVGPTLSRVLSTAVILGATSYLTNDSLLGTTAVLLPTIFLYSKVISWKKNLNALNAAYKTEYEKNQAKEIKIRELVFQWRMAIIRDFTDSNFTFKQIEQLYGIPPEKIRQWVGIYYTSNENGIKKLPATINDLIFPK